MTRFNSPFNGHGFREIRLAGELLNVYCDQKSKFIGSNDVTIIFDDCTSRVFLKDNYNKTYYKVRYSSYSLSDKEPELVRCDKNGNDLIEELTE